MSRKKSAQANGDAGKTRSLRQYRGFQAPSLYVHGAAMIEEIESCTGLPWDEAVNKISTLMNRGYIEGFAEPQQYSHQLKLPRKRLVSIS